MILKWFNIWKPERYHGPNRKGSFFEGWYYKLVSQNKQNNYAVIPGIYLDQDNKKSHAFIQFLDSESNNTLYFRFDIHQFYARKNPFEIQIAENKFTLNSISLYLNNEDRKITGQLIFSDLHPWPVSLFAPGVMGWYAFVPFMECYHGVLSFDHRISGVLNMDGKTINLTEGRGYLEKDWGVSFPQAYIWMQSNHFETNGTSLFLSVARIPWRGGAFRGFIAGLLHDGCLYCMTTYTGAKIEQIKISDRNVFIVISDRKYRLEIDASRSEGGILVGPGGTEFFQHITETLLSRVNVLFTERGKTILRGIGFPAGLEVIGNTELLT